MSRAETSSAEGGDCPLEGQEVAGLAAEAAETSVEIPLNRRFFGNMLWSVAFAGVAGTTLALGSPIDSRETQILIAALGVTGFTVGFLSGLRDRFE